MPILRLGHHFVSATLDEFDPGRRDRPRSTRVGGLITDGGSLFAVPQGECERALIRAIDEEVGANISGQPGDHRLDVLRHMLDQLIERFRRSGPR